MGGFYSNMWILGQSSHLNTLSCQDVSQLCASFLEYYTSGVQNESAPIAFFNKLASGTLFDKQPLMWPTSRGRERTAGAG